MNKPAFFKSHILPVLAVFLIPVFSAWFFSYAERDLDQNILKSIEADIASSTKMLPGDKAAALEFYRSRPISVMMASTAAEDLPLQKDFDFVELEYSTFRWMKRIAWICLALIVATFLIVSVSVAFSFSSHAAQYLSLKIGWPVLRISALLQVLGQALLMGFLSYWVTAIFFKIYVLKLIVLIGIFAAVAVFNMVKSIFHRVKMESSMEGDTVTEQQAPALWQRVRELAQRLHTAPPDHIVLGIVPSFFVTENPVRLDERVLSGRSLYLSLPMLQVMTTSEADAVLGHELAHFSGNDTLWSKKIGPLMTKFENMLNTLYDGLALPVGMFMAMFWKLYMLSAGKLSREREFRADHIGGEVTEPSNMGRALIKVCSYCEYRGKVESALFEEKKVDKELRLAEKLQTGYSSFLQSFLGDSKSVYSDIPHPFDSHPPGLKPQHSAARSRPDASCYCQLAGCYSYGGRARRKALEPAPKAPARSPWRKASLDPDPHHTRADSTGQRVLPRCHTDRQEGQHRHHHLHRHALPRL
jgi:Zn-dependent protease with chaperone function